MTNQKTYEVLAEETHLPLDAATRDKTSPVWDMSQERAFAETLLNQRFSFFLVFFSLVVAGGLNAKLQLHLQLVFTLGAIVSTLFATALDRSQVKLDLILEDLHGDSTHPFSIIDKRAKGRSARRLIGRWIPRLCCSALVLAAIMAWAELLSVPPIAGK